MRTLIRGQTVHTGSRQAFHNASTNASTRFLIDEGSELYYDATALLEVQKQERGDEPSRSRRPSNINTHQYQNQNPMHSQDLFHSNPHGQPQPSPHRSSSHQQPQVAHTPTQNSYPYGGPPTPSRFSGQGGVNSVSPGQFY